MKYKLTLTSRNGVLPFGQKIVLRKEPQNKFDDEAIEVLVNGKAVAHVAAYYKIRQPGTLSAGRLVDKIPGKEIAAVVVGENIAEVEIPSDRVVTEVMEAVYKQGKTDAFATPGPDDDQDPESESPHAK